MKLVTAAQGTTKNDTEDEKLNKSKTTVKRSVFLSDTTTTEKEEAKKSYNFLELARSKDSTSLLTNMSFTVDISKLYTVLASACTNQANPYCPV